MKPVNEFVIDRAVWARGPSSTNDGCRRQFNMLLSVDGMRCCVGIYLQACGFTDESMLDVGGAGSVPGSPGWLLRKDELFEDGTPKPSAEAEALYAANDRPLEDADRESRVAAYFARQGIIVTFVDGPVSP